MAELLNALSAFHLKTLRSRSGRRWRMLSRGNPAVLAFLLGFFQFALAFFFQPVTFASQFFIVQTLSYVLLCGTFHLLHLGLDTLIHHVHWRGLSRLFLRYYFVLINTHFESLLFKS